MRYEHVERNYFIAIGIIFGSFGMEQEQELLSIATTQSKFERNASARTLSNDDTLRLWYLQNIVGCFGRNIPDNASNAAQSATFLAAEFDDIRKSQKSADVQAEFQFCG